MSSTKCSVVQWMVVYYATCLHKMKPSFKFYIIFTRNWKAYFVSGSPRLCIMYFSRNKGKSFSSFTWYCGSLFLKQHTHNTVVEMVGTHLQRFAVVSATSNVKYASNLTTIRTPPPVFFIV